MPDKQEQAVDILDEAKKVPEQGSLAGDVYDAEDVFKDSEPWDPIETKMVVGSFAAAFIFLAVFH